MTTLIAGKRVTAAATALAALFAVGLPQSAYADEVNRQPCPPTSRCRRETKRSSWVTPSAPRTTSAYPQATALPIVLFTPEATLFSDDGEQVTTHFFSPNPVEPKLIQRWWPTGRFAPRGSTRGTRAPSGAR